jgi:hypothetical protein
MCCREWRWWKPNSQFCSLFCEGPLIECCWIVLVRYAWIFMVMWWQAAAVARGKGDYPERFGQPECQVLDPLLFWAAVWINLWLQGVQLVSHPSLCVWKRSSCSRPVFLPFVTPCMYIYPIFVGSSSYVWLCACFTPPQNLNLTRSFDALMLCRRQSPNSIVWLPCWHSAVPLQCLVCGFYVVIVIWWIVDNAWLLYLISPNFTNPVLSEDGDL